MRPVVKGRCLYEQEKKTFFLDCVSLIDSGTIALINALAGFPQ
jgi:hypothetical protein